MSVYAEICAAVQSAGIKTSAIALPTNAGTYAVVRMTSETVEQTGDDAPTVLGVYMQVDLYTDSNLDTKASAICAAAAAAGFTYRGRSDSADGARQHAEIRVRKLVPAT